LTPVVLDASAGVELALKTPVGRRFDAQMPGNATIRVPEHFYAEAAAVLRRLEPNQHAALGRVQAVLTRLISTPTRQVAVKPLMAEAWSLRHNLTIADALYVVLARHLDGPLVTADRKLANAPGLPVRTITP
jgi:predicted nucleic acid-binding protein